MGGCGDRREASRISDDFFRDGVAGGHAGRASPFGFPVICGWARRALSLLHTRPVSCIFISYVSCVKCIHIVRFLDQIYIYNIYYVGYSGLVGYRRAY